jgi:hypothetical protein
MNFNKKEYLICIWTLLLPFLLFVFVDTKFNIPIWIENVFMVLLCVYNLTVIAFRRRKTSILKDFGSKDLVVFHLSLIIMLVMMDLPIIDKLNTPVAIIFTCTGIIIALALIFSLGSDQLKLFILNYRIFMNQNKGSS